MHFHTKLGHSNAMTSWKNPTSPVISVIVPAYNEEKWLEASLSTLLEQETTTPYEIIVVDNGSTDRTSEIARAMGARVVYERENSLTRAREAGYRATQGKYLAYMDADSWAPSNWIESIAQGFKKHPKAVALYGSFRYKLKSSIHRFIFWLYFNIILRIYHWLVRGQSLAGCNFSVTRDALQKVGGFNFGIHFYGEDVELAGRLRKIGKIYPLNCEMVSSGRRFDEGGFLIPGFFLRFFSGSLCFRLIFGGRDFRAG